MKPLHLVEQLARAGRHGPGDAVGAVHAIGPQGEEVANFAPLIRLSSSARALQCRHISPTPTLRFFLTA